MATRTLGIKYEIRGFKEASESLKRINLGIKRSLKFDKELTIQRISNSKKVAAVEVANLERVEEQQLNQLERAKAEYRSYLGEPRNQDFGEVYKDILSRIRQYREEMRAGDLKAALKMAEELLGAIAVAEDIYKELGNKQFAGSLGQLKRIRGEILRGDRGRGRIDVGLLAIASTEEAQELELDFDALRDSAVLSSEQLTKFERQLRDASERVSGFLENRDRATQEGRINIIREGIESGTGEQIVQLQLSQLENEDLNERIEHLTGSIEAIQRDLRSPQLAAGIKRIEEAAAAKGVELTTATLTNFLEKEDRDSQEQEALTALLNIRQNEAQILQFREQLTQNIQQSRNF
ncbi:MAG: hypothetical protein AAGA80_19285 [Cyanobacteria bacterium P01_F01_bin.143]